jgi:hypothetical protein
MRPDRAHDARVVAKSIAWIFVFIVLSGVVKAQDDLTAALSTIGDGESGVVLLQDGGVLEGQITRAADWYVVGRAGGQMQVAATRVLYVCRSLHEAYEYRRHRLSQPTGETHLALAEWCLRHELLEEAETELTTARELRANERKQSLLDRRLAAAKERPKQTASIPTPTTSPVANHEKSPPATNPDLPPGVLELFTRKVQPVLVNNCTASKCHEPSGRQSFQLNRALLRGEANRRTTMQNLSATLALVDRAHPEVSPLLTVPRKTHGGMTGPVFGPRQQHAFKHLAEWVALVAPPARTAEPAANEGEENIPTSPAERGKRKSAPKTAYAQPIAKMKDPAAAQKPAANSEVTPIADPAVQPAVAIEEENGITSLRTRRRLRYGGSLESWKPRDPFDPEIFNRRQRAQAREIRPSVQPAARAAIPEKS